MEIVYGYDKFPKNVDTAVTIGTFDGLHLGHRKVLSSLFEGAVRLGLKSVILTFFPHPRDVIQSEGLLKFINTIDERIEMLSTMSIDVLIIQNFDQSFFSLSPFEFIRDILVERLNVKLLIVGHDHRFGKNREGDFNQLKSYSNIFDFEIEKIEVQKMKGINISSTKIRDALQSGNIDTANLYLTVPFYIDGRVVRGKGLGSQLEYPTANLQVLEAYKLIPKNGSYVVRVTHEKQTYHGMLNIGNRPTLKDKNKTIEVHIFDFLKDIYEEFIRVEFLHFLRDEEKFASLDLLRQQLQKDKKRSFLFLNLKGN